MNSAFGTSIVQNSLTVRRSLPSNLWLWRSVLGLGEPIRVGRKSLLLGNDSSDCMLLIVSGIAKLTCCQPDGQENTVCVRGPGSVIWRDPESSQTVLQVRCIALTECLVHRVNIIRFLEELEKGGAFAKIAFQSCVDLVHSVLAAMVENRTLTARERLDLLTAQLSSCGIQASGRGSGIRLKDCEIADLLGVSRGFLSRIKRLKPFPPRSLTVKNRQISRMLLSTSLCAGKNSIKA